MNVEVCKRFKNVWTNFPDELSNGKYQFNDINFFKEYCINNCSSYINKINAGCLYLFDEFFKNSSAFESVAKSNINIVEYIMIWLSYMLNLKDNPGITYINEFYDDFINDNKYKNSIDGVDAYNSYDDLINKKKLMKTNIKDISKFYNAFKLLCEMYTEFDGNTSNCKKCSGKANQFVEKYKEFNGNSSITGNSSYSQILTTLSTDYDNLKNKCNNISSFPTITTKFSVQRSEVTSTSSIESTLIPVLSIFGAIAIFLGISYKYSLFGFRKRDQKQYLREKLKK
ncbi:PIR protein [Plasmodium yoelii]|uniref:PIR protein n=2 Tax=Plasmodium yoelii TaxID=5861 RepID=A0AAF0B151_PLAYO|nr:PIR protein [Plasmodium yoelii]WBY56158.1 PIR protein [Plasmodium yoelii yoelii]CDU17121.1 YIR protein [Plasmodium yoelii]VTZ75616.1 PIR protein [Plasmodium yoelii]|eukprot:XP_022813224.1 PIR protein [Plasmodium yoelii]